MEIPKEKKEHWEDSVGGAMLRLYAHPYYFHAATQIEVKYVKSTDGEPAHTNGRYIGITPLGIDADLDTYYLYLVHELGHIILGHVHRSRLLRNDPQVEGYDKKRVGVLVNIAADAALVQFQDDAGVDDDPEDRLAPYYKHEAHYGETVEVIFWDMWSKYKDDLPIALGNHGAWNDDGEPSQDLGEFVEDVTQTAINRTTAMGGAYSCAAMTGAKRAFKIAHVPKINWKKLLTSSIIRSPRRDTVTAPNRRALGAGYYAPKTEEIASGYELIAAIDVSSSVGKEALGQFVGVLVQAMRTMNVKGTILPFAGQLYPVQKLTKTSKIKLEGAGATYLEPVYEYCSKLKKKPVLVVMTDGGLVVPPKPSFPVHWVISNNWKGFQAHYGKIIHLPKINQGDNYG